MKYESEVVVKVLIAVIANCEERSRKQSGVLIFQWIASGYCPRNDVSTNL